jgi:hypothetical protein
MGVLYSVDASCPLRRLIGVGLQIAGRHLRGGQREGPLPT